MALVDVNGDIRATGNVIAYHSSDARLKENILEITDALEKLASIRGVTYVWAEDAGLDTSGPNFNIYFPRTGQAGVIAQEVQEVMPDAVHVRDNDMLAIDYLHITALLIQCVRELKARVEQLESK